MIGGRSIGIVILVLVGAAVILSGVAYYQGGDSAFGSIRELGLELQVAWVEVHGPGRQAMKVSTIREFRLGRVQLLTRIHKRRRQQPPSASSGTVLRVKLNKLTVHRCPGYDCEISPDSPRN
jgi:hypothetical protein